MSRRDAERIYQAQRAGIFARLTQNKRVDELDAGHFTSRRERLPEANGPARGSQGYWDAGWRWITENRRKH